MTAPFVMPSTSREYLYIPLTGSYTNLMPVDIALVLEDTEPSAGDWHAAAWDGPGAKLLIGLGSTLEPAEGIYGAWARITATPEIPVIYSGQVIIT